MRNRERGQVVVLTLGMMLLCCAVVGVAIDGAKVFVHRRTLQNVADAGARAGAAELLVDRYYSSGGSDVMLDANAALDAARRTVALRGSGLRADIDASATAIQVAVSGSVRTGFLRLVGVATIPVSARAAARPIGSAGG